MRIFLIALLAAISYAQTDYHLLQDDPVVSGKKICTQMSYSKSCTTADTTATAGGYATGACDYSTYKKHCSSTDQEIDLSAVGCGTQTIKMFYQECTTCEGAGQTCVNSPGQTDTPADNPPADNPPADNPPAGGDTGTCPAACKTAYELPANKDTLCQGKMDELCSEIDVALCISEFKAVCGAGECPASCAAAIADSKNHETVCGDNNDLVLPSPCVVADGLNCVGEIAMACASDGKDTEPGMCTTEQTLQFAAAIMLATTPECKTVQELMDSDGDPTDKQGCDCLGSGADFSALKTMECKMDKDSDNISVMANGGGVCSSSSAFSLFFAVAALFFSFA